MALLHVNKLNISVKAGDTEKQLVKNVSFSVKEGEILGLVGASGSGKSLTSMAIGRILSPKYKVTSEEVLFMHRSLNEMSEEEMCDIRGREIGYIFQEPMTSLNPLLSIGYQVEEPLKIHYKKEISEEERLERVKEALKDVGLQPTPELLKAYPHELSGGMRQRVMIAMAFICRPRLVVADEITTALDAATTEVIVKLLLEHKERYKTAIIFISHDRKLVEEVSDRVLFMEKGEVVDTEITKGNRGQRKEQQEEKAATCGKQDRKIILTVDKVDFAYRTKELFGKVKEKPVLHDINMVLYEGETLGVVGVSGGGKSTLMKVITGLQKANSGSVTFAEGYDHFRMVFQDPYSSLNRSHTIGKILAEALIIRDKKLKKKDKNHIRLTKSEINKKIFQMLKEVDLNSEMAYRMLSELSGGQRQRVAIACALITGPQIVILDEPVTAIDAELREQILKLLKRLKAQYGCSYIFISHDPEVIEKTCDRVMVLENGTLKEK